ncbi:hypothetical protein GCM10027346_33470 [Hymenobacter seoulensis]
MMYLSRAVLAASLVLGTYSAVAQNPTPVPMPTVPGPPAASRVQAYTYVEQMPAFPGGKEALLATIQQNLRYPAMAPQRGLEGRAFVQYIVLPDGSLTQIEVIKGLGAGYDEEAIRVMESLPRFSPGRQNGRAVAVIQTIPIIFKKP